MALNCGGSRRLTTRQTFINTSHLSKHGEVLEEDMVNFIFTWIVSVFIVGGMVAAVFAGMMAEKLGRKKSLIISQVKNAAIANNTPFCYAYVVVRGVWLTNLTYLNPLVPDAHYSERRDKLASLQYKLLEDN